MDHNLRFTFNANAGGVLIIGIITTAVTVLGLAGKKTKREQSLKQMDNDAELLRREIEYQSKYPGE